MIGNDYLSIATLVCDQCGCLVAVVYTTAGAKECSGSERVDSSGALAAITLLTTGQRSPLWLATGLIAFYRSKVMRSSPRKVEHALVCVLAPLWVAAGTVASRRAQQGRGPWEIA